MDNALLLLDQDDCKVNLKGIKGPGERANGRCQVMEATVESLFKSLEQVPDPRKPRGIRHPFQAILRLTLLGLVSGQTTMAHIAL